MRRGMERRDKDMIGKKEDADWRREVVRGMKENRMYHNSQE